MSDLSAAIRAIAGQGRVQMFIQATGRGDFQVNVSTDGKAWAVRKGGDPVAELTEALASRLKVLAAHGQAVTVEQPAAVAGLQDLLG